MRVSLAYTGFGSILADLPAIRAADESGLDGVWCAEHICHHDAVVPATVYLRETEHLELGLMGISPAGRHPGVTAMELASLAEIAPGRVRAAVGTGVTDMIAKLDRTVQRPVKETISLLDVLRTALAGGELTGRYPSYGFERFVLNPLAAPPRLDIMAIRPRMVDAAARYADGVSFSAGSSREYMTRTVKEVETTLAEVGRPRAEFRVSACVAAFITEDVETARTQVGGMLSMFDPATAEYLAAGAIPDGHLVSAVAEGGPSAMRSVLTPEVIDTVAMVCQPDGIADSLRRYAETGVDEVAITLFAPPDHQVDLVREIASSRPRVSQHTP